MAAATTSFCSTADKSIFYTISGALAGIPAFVLIYAEIKGEMQLGGGLACSFLLLGYLVLGATYFLDTSELILDDMGIRRKIFGRMCMPITWRGIKVIREQFLMNQRVGGEIRIDILPNTPRDFSLRLRKTIKFSEQVEKFDELIDILNQRITQYSIPVEVCSNGIWRPRSELVATPER
jgi:hypothetical protein